MSFGIREVLERDVLRESFSNIPAPDVDAAVPNFPETHEHYADLSAFLLKHLKR